MLIKSLFNFICDKIISSFALFFFRTYCKGEIKNIHILKNLSNKPFMIAMNHTSHIDWCILHPIFKIMLKREISFVAKKELFESPFWKPFMSFSKSIRIDREKVTSQLLRIMVSKVRENTIVGIFPEGTRSRDGKLLKAKDGVIRIAMFLKIPIVPIGLTGFHELLPKGKFLPKRSTCVISIGEPIDFSNEKDFNKVPALTEKVMKHIAMLSNQEYPHSHTTAS